MPNGPPQRNSFFSAFDWLPWVAGVTMLVCNGNGLAADLRSQLEQLSTTHGFSIKGLDLIEDDPGRTTSGTLYQQVEQLLEDYDHIVLRGPNDGIRRLVVVSQKRGYAPPPPPPPAQQRPPPKIEAQSVDVPTERKGAHHKVSGNVEGNEGQQARVELLVDTGASFLVLPTSLAEQLGLRLSDMLQRSVQTAKGPVEALIGRVPQLRIGNATFPQVETAFINDAYLGGESLLGMSVFRGHKVVLDDAANRLTLTPTE